jgi:hypothetical protein
MDSLSDLQKDRFHALRVAYLDAIERLGRGEERHAAMDQFMELVFTDKDRVASGGLRGMAK